MTRRIHLHGYNLASLHKNIEPHLLPDFLGGQEPMDNSPKVRELLKMNEMFFWDAAFGYVDYTKDYTGRRTDAHPA